VRILSAVLLVFCLAGCNRGVQSKDAVRQAVVEYLKGKSMPTDSMEISVTAVTFNGSKADATVSFAPKGGDPAQGMSIPYQLEQKDGKWAVVGRATGSAAPHAGAAVQTPAETQAPAQTAAPAQASPHGAQMPSPENLPPAGKK
jgi:hypothetical protein